MMLMMMLSSRCGERWKLIHDVERAMASRGEDDSAKRPQKKPFRRRWTRADLMHTVLA
jgi:hypothetical protein